MRLPASAPEPPLPWRRLLRIFLTGVGCALATLALGRLAERAVLGAGEEEARARAETIVRDDFDRMSRALRVMASGLADAPSVVAAAQGDVTAARRLFAATEAALAVTAGEPDGAVTVYAADGRPLAWAGRPSELPAGRLGGDESWFFAPGALGLRLVHVTPVTDQTTRVGTVATERTLVTAADPTPGSEVFRYSSRVAPVSLELNAGRARTVSETRTFDIATPSGERLVTASVASGDLALTRGRWRRATTSLALVVLAIAVVLLSGPLLDWRNRALRVSSYVFAVVLTALVVIAARLLLRLASPADWSDATIFSGTEYASSLFAPLMTSPFDFLLTAMTLGGVVALLVFAVEAARLHRWHHRRLVAGTSSTAAYIASQLGVGVVLAVLLVGYFGLLRDTVASTTPDLLHFSLHPLDSGSRLAMQIGLVIWHATAVGCALAILRGAVMWWSVPRGDWPLRAATVGFWALPLVLWTLARRTASVNGLALLVALGGVILLATFATRLRARYRHGSQAFRLTMMTFGLVAPAVIFYPSVFQLAWQAKSQLVETRYAPQAFNQRQTVYQLLKDSLTQIDRFPGLADFVSGPPVAFAEASTDSAFQVWRLTGLAMYPVTSSVELYGPDGLLLSRFAFNLPEDLTGIPKSEEASCTWDVYEEVSPFFAEERRVLHAGRAVCGPDGQRLGSVVVHAILDYANLPFIASPNPYVEIVRPTDQRRGEGIAGRDVEFASYGWSRTPVYTSGVTAWTLDDEVFARIEESRMPVWAELSRGDQRYDVFILNDRGGIYALGFPVLSPLDHVVNLAEITVLAWTTYALLLAVTALFGAFSRRGTNARALLREIRASFYRKLLLAFIAATVVPVVALAIATRNYVADEIRANVEQEAIRTASAARRVVEDLVTPRATQQGVDISDNLMVWVSRLIDQDVNIYSGPRLMATSERNLFASGLLPTRTSADVYRALALENDATTVTREQVGTLEPYLVAAASMPARPPDAILTVPLTSREREIEGQIDTLDRRVLLGALLFVFSGAAIGYWLAERIADPVNRLTRATRRLARGDLGARIAATSSDELRRLVEDFNRMAGELQRQQKELERTHRLEAWAEMARQVAHEIKNPLTPIQLNAEHLRRVHADRGQPMGAVLDDCVSTILTQVKLLRQIASEFSSFASSPIARPSAVDVPQLVHEAIDPYRAGLSERIRFDVDVPDRLPPVYVDRTLIGRSLANIVENALHAMPGRGALTVVARHVDSSVQIRVSDTGAGMDPQALARAFEPYFSTKTTGTGLGLPIAKRNVEISGGTITLTSERDRGTTVELMLPTAPSYPSS